MAVDHVAYNMCQVDEPRTLTEALASELGKQWWKAAADLEFQSLIDVGVINPNSMIEAKDQLCDNFTEQ